MPEDWCPAAPQVDDAWLWVWRAWWRLHQDRPWRSGGMGPAIPCRIPWRVVVDWCEFYGHGAEAAAFMDSCFEHMDGVFFTFHARQVAAAMSKP